MKATLSCILFLTLSWFPSWAQPVPHLIPFQGHLTRPSAGNPAQYEPVPDGRYDTTFAFYTTPAGGTPVWGPERHEDLVVKGGLVNVLLGSIESFDSVLAGNPNFFGQVLFAGISIDADGNPGTADPELIPRETLRAKPQALNADTLDGRDWRDFFDGTDAQGTVSPGTTKVRNTNLFDGIDAGAVFVNPNQTSNPKAKTTALTDGIAGALNLNGDIGVGGNLSVTGDILGIVVDASGDEGALRIGDIQICWGQYVSTLTDDGAFDRQYDAAPTTLPESFIDAEYALIAAPSGNLPSSFNERLRASTVTLYERTPDTFKALTHWQASEGADLTATDYPGWYLAIGRWR